MDSLILDSVNASWLSWPCQRSDSLSRRVDVTNGPVARWYSGRLVTYSCLDRGSDLGQCHDCQDALILPKIILSTRTSEDDCYAHSQAQSCYSCLPWCIICSSPLCPATRFSFIMPALHEPKAWHIQPLWSTAYHNKVRKRRRIDKNHKNSYNYYDNSDNNNDSYNISKSSWWTVIMIKAVSSSWWARMLS